MRVLVVDSNEASGARLAELVERAGFEAERPSDPESALELLGPGGVRLAVWAWSHEGLSGLEAARRLRARPELPWVHLILVAAAEVGAVGEEALAAGADDVVWNLERLPFSLALARRQLALRERVSGLQRALETEVQRDGLTRVWSRETILEFLDKELARSKRAQGPTGAALIRLYGLEALRGERGSDGADAALRRLAEGLQTCVRQSDGVGRWGPDRFLIVLSGCNQQRAEGAAARILRFLNARVDLGGLRVGSLVAATEGSELAAADLVARLEDQLG